MCYKSDKVVKITSPSTNTYIPGFLRVIKSCGFSLCLVSGSVLRDCVNSFRKISDNLFSELQLQGVVTSSHNALPSVVQLALTFIQLPAIPSCDGLSSIARTVEYNSSEKSVSCCNARGVGMHQF